jgi:regulator of protease activity HflC (stomatin/prohibitin superfamily)
MFEWLAEFLRILALVIPRRIIVRATHGGVKWPWGRRPVEMTPGFWWYWPCTTEQEVIVTARQTLALPPQSLLTRDRKQVVVGTLVVYEIDDVVEAIGERNWDVDTTINDVAQAAVVEVVTRRSVEEILHGVTDGITEELTARCREQLAEFGVYVHRVGLTSFSECRILNLVGIPKDHPNVLMPGAH